MNLLIVDDHPTNLKLLRAQLEAEGHAVFEAHDGVDALALLERQRVDAVISDILMPRMDGYSLCYEIRKHARLHDLPIIIYSSTYTSPGDQKLALDMGADKYLTRPVSVETLVAALHEVGAQPHAAPRPDARREVEVLKEYNERLVSKLKEKNTELMVAEGKFRALVEQSIVGIYLIQDDRFVYVNPRMLGIFGRSEEEMTSRPLSDFLVPEDQALARENIRKRISGEAPSLHYELRMLHQSGAVLQAEVHGSLAEYNGRPAVMGTLLDITERRREEEAGARLVAILEATPDLVSIANPAGQLVYLNRAGRKILGLDELADFTRYHLQEFHDAANAHVVLTEGIPTAMREGAWSGETELLALDGHAIAVSQVILAHKKPDGTVAFLSTIARDITTQKRAEEALRVSERRHRRLFETAPDGILILDADTGQVIDANPFMKDLLGYSLEEFLGKKLWEVGPFKGVAASKTTFAELRQKDRVHYERLPLETKDGRRIEVEFISNAYLVNEKRLIQCNIRDITDRLQLEAQFRQAQKMDSVGQLAGGIAHDFNNLLTVINGMSELVLAEVSTDVPMHADVQEILHAGQRAATLTRQLLAFSRQQILEPRVLSLNTVVEGTESLLRRLLGEDIDLVVVPTPGVGDVKADPGQIEQVITNLAVNARDAMPQGGQLTIETQNVEIDEADARRHGVAMAPGSYVRLVVRDSGVGMDEATCARIFEPFFTTKGPGKGTGLGLSTVYGIVKQSHGFIWVESEVGQGTSFKICLPRVTEVAGTDRPAPTAVSGSGTETILLVEDNAGLRKLATRLLAPAGYTVLGAASGEDALRLLERHDAPVHLLLSDVVMPGMSGRDLAEQLARTRPQMKVLYVSGYTGDAIVRHGVLEAQVPFLNKPFTAAALLRKVREVLDS
jgi:two-component system, cell cycle sensor histidine kinase and response regulator CckA